MSTFWFVDVLVCRRFDLSTFWFVDVLVCRRFGLSTFRFVDVLVCRRFGLSTFWFVDVLVVDVSVCRRFDQLPLNSTDDARETCMGSWLPNDKFTSYFSTLEQKHHFRFYVKYFYMHLLAKNYLSVYLFQTWFNAWTECTNRNTNFTHK